MRSAALLGCFSSISSVLIEGEISFAISHHRIPLIRNTYSRTTVSGKANSVDIVVTKLPLVFIVLCIPKRRKQIKIHTSDVFATGWLTEPVTQEQIPEVNISL